MEWQAASNQNLVALNNQASAETFYDAVENWEEEDDDELDEDAEKEAEGAGRIGPVGSPCQSKPSTS